ncbi:hypothetical protein AGR4A_Lc40591 [Agrobacterium tumefaciens str. B6]|uniref:Uncharacterized protein n=1 Tax=Agrobacterium tumefaciens str. B6 TaxID=1183423 RepID=A0A822V7Q5_AGRTU|nr:hypothetical protein AGR4A_Lc40591 [Agrobacterium tumefaciens str. B6]
MPPVPEKLLTRCPPMWLVATCFRNPPCTAIHRQSGSMATADLKKTTCPMGISPLRPLMQAPISTRASAAEILRRMPLRESMVRSFGRLRTVSPRGGGISNLKPVSIETSSDPINPASMVAVADGQGADSAPLARRRGDKKDVGNQYGSGKDQETDRVCRLFASVRIDREPGGNHGPDHSRKQCRFTARDIIAAPHRSGGGSGTRRGTPRRRTGT